MNAAEFDGLLATCTGPDDPRFRAAEMLADAWQPALATAERIGYGNGYAAGYWAAEQEMGEAWANVARGLKSFWQKSDEADRYRREAASGASGASDNGEAVA